MPLARNIATATTAFPSTPATLPFPISFGVRDTVRALGIPGSSGLVLWRHAFHNAALNARVPYARQALSIDENRQISRRKVGTS